MNKVIVKPKTVFGDSEVIQEVRHAKGRERKFRMLCKCGRRFTALFSNLSSGKTKSCGCRLSHGKPNNIVRFNGTDAAKEHLKKLHLSLRGSFEDFVENFWAKVNKNTGYLSPTCSSEFAECWNWTGADNGTGYGMLRIAAVQNSPILASHVSFFLANGCLPENDACHVCDNRRCVRPSHLFDGTNLDNAWDRKMKRMGGVLIAVPTPNLEMGENEA